MQVHLNDALVRKLTALPESGMGYQLCDLTLTDGRRIGRVPVFNAEIADVPPEAGPVRAEDVRDVALSRTAEHP